MQKLEEERERMLLEMKICEAAELTLTRQQQNGDSFAPVQEQILSLKTVVTPELVTDNGLTADQLSALKKLVTWKLHLGCQIIIPEMV